MDTLSTREKTRVRQAAAILPELAREAVKIHGQGKRAEAAVLSAWAGLAGVLGWAPEMIERVEQELKRNA